MDAPVFKIGNMRLILKSSGSKGRRVFDTGLLNSPSFFTETNRLLRQGVVRDSFHSFPRRFETMAGICRANLSVKRSGKYLLSKQ